MLLDLSLSREQASLIRQVLDQDITVWFNIQGCSMRPILVAGDVVETRSIQPQDLHLGDVVVYDPGRGSLLVHRVIKIQNGTRDRRLLLQGDAVVVPDEWIRPDQVIARVTARKRKQLTKRMDSSWERWVGYWKARLLPVVKSVYVRVHSLSRHGV